jgi:hypothetical protein
VKFVRAVGKDQQDVLTGVRRLLFYRPVNIPIQIIAILSLPEKGMCWGDAPGNGRLQPKSDLDVTPQHGGF